jgi:hypothetical protein
MTTSNSTDANKALVLAGINGVFIDRDPSSIAYSAITIASAPCNRPAFSRDMQTARLAR